MRVFEIRAVEYNDAGEVKALCGTYNRPTKKEADDVFGFLEIDKV